MVVGGVRRAALLLLLALPLAGCAKSGEDLTREFWRTWEETDALMQEDFPGRPPIVLIHGWNGSEFTWPPPERLRRLESRFRRDIYFFTYRTGLVPERFPPLEVIEEQLGLFLARFGEVDIVAHSMGGLILRQYLQHHPDPPVRRIVFLAVPHFGTEAARVLARISNVSPLGNLQADEMLPGSDFLWQLNELEGMEMEGIPVLNVYVGGETEEAGDLVVAPASAFLPDAVNVAVEGSHHSLAGRFPDFAFIRRFLEEGVRPVSQRPPRGRRLWLRVYSAHRGFVRLTRASVHRIDERGMPRRRGVELCCETRTAMYATPATTVIVRDPRPGEVLELIVRGGREVHTLRLGLRPGPQPVTLRIVEMGEPNRR